MISLKAAFRKWRELSNSGELTKGWHNIAVRVQGGGITPGYFAELRFDGKTYPKNPSVPPARRLKDEPHGKAIIASEQDAKLLYSDMADAKAGHIPRP